MPDASFVCRPTIVGDNEFVDFWADQYRYSLEYLYENSISIKPFTDDAIRNLFLWKNGGKLSESKSESVERNYIQNKKHASVENAIGFVKEGQTEEAAKLARDFLINDFPEGGAIWRIFWLHCCDQRFPIYDQHVHRAMVFIKNGQLEELGAFSEEDKVESYLTKCRHFHSRFSGEQRKVDKALVTFGLFLKRWPGIAKTALQNVR